ncbi:hypothetical protein QCA50_002480 [Cerrena zonata]|uniref:Uncharacterized protein n=1 Tax=Cerrena zonata TaxID=2478898 RepID=A0AAW0GZ13_9APHY
MDSPFDCKQGQSVNPDISGIGVRLSFYLQNFLLVLLVDRSWEDAPSALWTFTSTSCGLTIAAIVQARSGQLSFFQALQVSNLVWMANFGTFLALASYSRHRERHEEEEEQITDKSKKTQAQNWVKVVAMFQMFFSMSLTFYTWSRTDVFNQDHCAQFVKYVAFFAVDFPALTSGKKLGLSATALLTFGYLLVTAHEMYSSYMRRKKPASEDLEMRGKPQITVTSPDTLEVTIPDGALQPEPPSPIRSHSPHPSVSTNMSSNTNKTTGRSKRHRRHSWATNMDPMLLGISIFQLLVFAYFIVSTELLLKHNPAVDSSDKEWGFGQILALIVAVPSVVSVFKAFRDHGFENLHHRKSKAQWKKRG